MGDDADTDPGDHRAHRKVPALHMVAVRPVVPMGGPTPMAAVVAGDVAAMGTPVGATAFGMAVGAPVGTMALDMAFHMIASPVMPPFAPVASHGVRGGEQADGKGQSGADAGERGLDVPFACHG